MGAGDGHNGGETAEAGLPDITGSFGIRMTSDNTYASTAYAQGAFSAVGNGSAAVSNTG